MYRSDERVKHRDEGEKRQINIRYGRPTGQYHNSTRIDNQDGGGE